MSLPFLLLSCNKTFAQTTKRC